MTDLCKQILADQFDASLCTFGACRRTVPGRALERARWRSIPSARWRSTRCSLPTFTWSSTRRGLSRQPFHQANPQLFGDYEQLQYREPQSLYERSQIRTYLRFCAREGKGHHRGGDGRDVVRARAVSAEAVVARGVASLQPALHSASRRSVDPQAAARFGRRCAVGRRGSIRWPGQP